MTGNRLYTTGRSEQMQIPHCLSWQVIFSVCKNKKSQIKKYRQDLDTVKADLSHNLDLVNLLSRLRMHGFALALLLDN